MKISEKSFYPRISPIDADQRDGRCSTPWTRFWKIQFGCRARNAKGWSWKTEILLHQWVIRFRRQKRTFFSHVKWTSLRPVAGNAMTLWVSRQGIARNLDNKQAGLRGSRLIHYRNHRKLMKNHGGTRLAFIHDMNRHYWSFLKSYPMKSPKWTR